MGGKRDRIDSNFRPKKCAKRYIRHEDRISQLPDDILVDILSFLSLKEAARTSVLSSRWMNVWKHTSYLNFDADSALDKIRKQYKIRHKLLYSEGRKYVKWVNRVVRSNKAFVLKEFRIRFPLDIRSGNAITQWLEFAFARQVQRLELDLQNYTDSSRFYCFPEEFLAQSSSGAPKLQTPSDSFCIHHPHMLVNFKSLRELSFKNVHVADRAVEFFLNNCPLLERLVVHRSNKISKLEVCGSSLMLKHLEIAYCFGLKSLKVSAPSLTSLRATTLEGLLLENVPMLVDVYVNCAGDEISLRRLFCTLSCCISQLEILRLMLVYGEGKKELCKFAELPKLKKLVIEYLGRGDESLTRLAALIRASPYMEEFVLKYEWCRLPWKDREVKDAIKFPHEHLKVVKFSGFYGRTSDLELVRYILENCVVLEKLIINPKRERYPCTLDVKRIAKKNAKQQIEAAEVPEHVELVIL